MTVSSLHQLGFFCLSIAAGAAVGVLYGLLTAAREALGSALAAALTDLIFWTAAGGALIYMSLRFNDGGIRAYQIFGVMSGCFAQYLLFGKITLGIARKIVRLAAIILFPIIFLLRGGVLFIGMVYEKARMAVIKIGQTANRLSARGKSRKKMRKKYKKLL